jgi:hypothetical protein
MQYTSFVTSLTSGYREISAICTDRAVVRKVHVHFMRKLYIPLSHQKGGGVEVPEAPIESSACRAN